MPQDDLCDTDSSCARTYVSDYQYVGGYFGACNEELMLQALVENGPLSVAYMVYDDFLNYEGGIYHHTGFKNEFNPLEVIVRVKVFIKLTFAGVTLVGCFRTCNVSVTTFRIHDKTRKRQ